MREDQEALEARVGRQVEEAYRRAIAPSPGARERMFKRVGELAPPRSGGSLWARLVSGPAMAPQRVALAAACVLVAVSAVALVGRALDPDSGARTIYFPGMSETPLNPVPAEKPVVRFELSAPEAGRVTLVGDFNGWDRQATPMRRAESKGSWTVSVPLERGRHTYGFFVDGVHWVADPLAPLAPADGFGGVNSVIVVNGPGAS